MRKNPFKVEEVKSVHERGFFLSPEGHSQPEERGIEWARNPELMQQRKQERAEAARGLTTPIDR